MATFGLVHGAYHGGWCWDLIVPELEALGHGVVAPDLPCDVPGAGASVYADAVDAALGDAAGDVVLVGHSLGGITIPIVAERRPAAHLVYLAAVLPAVGRSLNDAMAGQDAIPERDGPLATDNGDNSASVIPEAAVDAFYGDVDDELARWAVSKLRRQYWVPAQEVTPLNAWPDAPSTYVVCSADRAVSPAWGRRVAVERCGREAVEIDASHSPFLSKPSELASILDALT